MSRLVLFGVPRELNADILLGHFSWYGEVTEVWSTPAKPFIFYVQFVEEGAERGVKDSRTPTGQAERGLLLMR